MQFILITILLKKWILVCLYGSSRYSPETNFNTDDVDWKNQIIWLYGGRILEGVQEVKYVIVFIYVYIIVYIVFIRVNTTFLKAYLSER